MSTFIKSYALGKSKAAIFKSEQYNSYSVKFQKSYMDKNKQWKNTDFFNLTDLRDLHALIGFMLDKQVKEKSGQTSENNGQNLQNTPKNGIVSSSQTPNIQPAADEFPDISDDDVPF
jgi:hypothetical protein